MTPPPPSEPAPAAVAPAPRAFPCQQGECPRGYRCVARECDVDRDAAELSPQERDLRAMCSDDRDCPLGHCRAGLCQQ